MFGANGFPKHFNCDFVDHEPDASNPTSQKSMVSNFAAEDIENVSII